VAMMLLTNWALSPPWKHWIRI